MNAAHTGIDPQTAADINRHVNELRDRIRRVEAHDPADLALALSTIAADHPDLVTFALDDAGAPR